MRYFRFLSLLPLVLTLLACIGGIIVANYVTPSSLDGRIAILHLGVPQSSASIPRRALVCTPTGTAILAESCRVAINGQELRIDIVYSDTRHAELQTRIGLSHQCCRRSIGDRRNHIRLLPGLEGFATGSD